MSWLSLSHYELVSGTTTLAGRVGSVSLVLPDGAVFFSANLSKYVGVGRWHTCICWLNVGLPLIPWLHCVSNDGRTSRVNVEF